MMTGTSPLEHGILDFVQFDPASGSEGTDHQQRAAGAGDLEHGDRRRQARRGVRLVGDVSRRSDRRPRRVGSAVHFLVQGIRRPRRGIVFPPESDAWARDGLTQAERAADYAAVHAYLPWLSEADYNRVADSDDPYAHPVSALRRMLIETNVYSDLSQQWIREQHPDLAVVYLQATDTIGHVFAPYAPPRQAAISAT